jgi:alkylation response protein AidB-like acyl-CoA dehydrogenase
MQGESMESHPIITTARELQPLIRQHLVEGEQRARLTQEVVTAVGQAGFFRLCAPREVGGLEVSPLVALAVTEVLSAADPAVGWYMVNSVPACLAAAFLPEPARVELFAEPDWHFGNSGAPGGQAVAVDGGYRVSGQWPLVTGCEDAKWCGLAGVVMENDTPRQLNGFPDRRLFYIPTTTLDVALTWQEAAAMRGTDSNAVSVRDVFVPEAFAHTPAKPVLIDRPLFRLPQSQLFFPMGAAVAFGVLETAVQSATDDLGAKVSSFSGQTLRDQAPIQELIANSDAALRAARAGLVEAMAAVWEAASTKAEVPLRLRAQLYASCYYAVDVVRDTISRLYARGTRAAFLQGHPVERALRNLHAIVFGFEAGRPFQHSAGRVLMGGAPYAPIF